MSPDPKPTISDIRAALERQLEPLTVEVIDDSLLHAGHAGASAGGHYRVRIVCAAFAGRSRLERHRLVYQALAAYMQRSIHALSIDARAPGEPP